MKMFDADKTRMIGLLYGEKNYDSLLSRFHPVPERHRQTDMTDGQSCYINIARQCEHVTCTLERRHGTLRQGVDTSSSSSSSHSYIRSCQMQLIQQYTIK